MKPVPEPEPRRPTAMKKYMMVQYTPEWWETRRGVPTASAFDRILTPKTRKPSSAQKTYIHDLVGETADLRPNWFSSRPMNPAQRHGLETEPEARRWYTMEYGRDVQLVGFVCTDDGRLGCSPDGLIDGENAGLELKCVQGDTQARYLEEPNELLMDYRCQVHGQLIVCGFEYVDLVSYFPGLDPVVIRVVPDDFTLQLAEELVRFNEKYDAALARFKVKRLYPEGTEKCRRCGNRGRLLGGCWAASAGTAGRT